MNEFFLDMTHGQKELLVESPMFRYECCQHCSWTHKPRHDGHPDACVDVDCEIGHTMVGEPL